MPMMGRAPQPLGTVALQPEAQLLESGRCGALSRVIHVDVLPGVGFLESGCFMACIS